MVLDILIKNGKIIDGPLSHGKPHSRYFRTFPRILSLYVREKQIIPLEKAIRK